jgi:hypothetical protein
MNPNASINDPKYPPPRPPPKSARERSGCLNLWLGASALFGALAVVGLVQIWDLVLRTPNAFQRISPIALLIYSGLLIGMLVSVWGIWKWKRWAVYAAAMCSIVSPFAESALKVADAQDWIAPFVQIAILYYLVKDKWDDFD